jgi:spore cortex formation protein SpoVR/YcgB (stage V sporulation)
MMSNQTTTLAAPAVRRPLFDGPEWNFELLKSAYDAIEEIGVGEMRLDIYPNAIEVITAEQMLDAYSSIGMPHMYRHWSFGKHFLRDEAMYRKGARALAYELVINSNPCINYIMEENSMTMQTLVLAHAAMGHNHFFKNNEQFRAWTRPDAILDYLDFAKSYVARCEEKFGTDQVEMTLDAAHALMSQGVSRHPGAHKAVSFQREQERELARREYEEQSFNDLWRTVPKGTGAGAEPAGDGDPKEAAAFGLPEENFLYFLEKHAPKLDDWQRELLRIVRMLSTYFYPQRQTKLMNEGCATWTHHHILTRMYEKGLLSEGSMLEFLHSHSSVVMQPGWKDRRYSGINPYALGFAMMRDIERIATEPTREDEAWFPAIAGNGDALGTLKQVWADYRDESFILQHLSPKVIRDFRMFEVRDRAASPYMTVAAIHDEHGYRDIRRALAQHYAVSTQDPDLQIVDADLTGSRRLLISHRVRNGVLLEKADCERVLTHIARLWGYRVKLVETDVDTGKTLREHETMPLP